MVVSTSIPLANEIVKPKEPEKSEAQLRCEANGGKWDAVNNACIMPEESPEPKKEPEPEVQQEPVVAQPTADTKKGEVLVRGRDGAVRVQTPEEREFLEFRAGAPTAQERIMQQRQQRASQEERAAQVTETGVLEQQSPEFEEIGFTRESPARSVPVIGPSIEAVEFTTLDFLSSGILGDKIAQRAKDAKNVVSNEEEYARELALTEVEKRVRDEGLTASERFGAFVEAIPVIGGLASKYAGDLNTPTGNIRDIRTNINSLREAAEFQASQAREGKVDPQAALDTILDMQERVEELEARLKLLLQSSTVLRTSSDDLNVIETEIFRTKQKLFVAGQVAAAGAIQEPSPDSIFMTLKEFQDGNN